MTKERERERDRMIDGERGKGWGRRERKTTTEIFLKETMRQDIDKVLCFSQLYRIQHNTISLSL